MREGLRLILADKFQGAVFGEARDAREGLHMVWRQEWDLVILDISLPGTNGLELLKQIKRFHRKLRVLVLSMYPEDQFALRMLKAGAAGYLTKDSASHELIRAIRKVLAGGRYISPTLAEQMASSLDIDVLQPPHERLSDREYLILRLIASGKTVGQIARELSLSVKTISTYRARTLEKMAMKTNAELTRYAIENALGEGRR
jgi:DNA-binding NarL/FixJ family response regulator